ncbi:PilZ domain-containing protein [Thiolapillus sp.]
MEPSCNKIPERRSFLRIADQVILKYRKVKDLQALPGTQRPPADISSFTIKARFFAINQKLRPARAKLEQQSRELAAYLKAIDEKLDLLADLAFETEHDLIDMPTRQVDLSAGGTSFHAEKPLELGTLLELWLLLLPSHAGIVTYANVVYCKRNRDPEDERYPYKIGVEFRNMREEDMDLIICHVLKKEADERRLAKKNARKEGQ